MIDKGDKLYKYQGRGAIAEYVIIGSLNDKLIVECQNCQHSDKCEVIVAKISPDKIYGFDSMLHDDNDDSCEINEYKAWHTSNTPQEYYYSDIKDARKAVADSLYQFYCDEAARHKSSYEKYIENARKTKASQPDYIETGKWPDEKAGA